MTTNGTGDWQSTACCLCSINCGLQVKVEDNTIVKVKGDRANPFSQGYTCPKGLTVAKYAHHKQRVLQPLKKTADGSHEEISWEQAFSEIGAKMRGIINEHGGTAVGLVGGGGQANHFDFPYVKSFLSLIGTPWHFNALGQEYTHQYWVNRHLFGSDGVQWEVHAEDTECLMVMGSNPYMSHGIQRARVLVKEISKDPERTLIVVDPRNHETAQLADHYLQIRPGTDMYFILAMLNVIVTEDLIDQDALGETIVGWEDVKYLADLVTPAMAARLCDLKVEDIVKVTRKFAAASSACIRIDMGILHSKFAAQNSFLLPLIQGLTGNLARPGGSVFPTTLFNGAAMAQLSGGEARVNPRTKVAGIERILGLFPPNAIPEEILEAGDDKLRCLFIEGANPLISYADHAKMTEAFEALELLVCIDPAMTETARMADYVLPVPVGYEKYEMSVFSKGWPEVYAHLRQPVLEAPEGVRQECLIFYEILKAAEIDPTQDMLFAVLGMAIDAGEPAPVLSLLRGIAMGFAGEHYQELLEAGTISEDGDAGEQVVQHLLSHPEGAYLCTVKDRDNWQRLRHEHHKMEVNHPNMLGLFADFTLPEDTDFRQNPEFPLILSTGERSDYNANSIQRDPSWRKKHRGGYVRMHRTVAEEIQIEDGETVSIVTEWGQQLAPAMVTEDIYPGNISMPHGHGIMWENEETGELEQIGANVQALISAKYREPIAGVPYHKFIPARIEKVA